MKNKNEVSYEKASMQWFYQFRGLLENQMCTDFKEDFEFFYLEAVLHMYTAKCADRTFLYPNNIQDMIYEKCFFKTTDDLGLKNVLKGCLEDLHWEQNQSFLQFSYYGDLMCLTKEDVLKVCSFLSKNQFYSTFDNYKDVRLKIQNKVQINL